MEVNLQSIRFLKLVFQKEQLYIQANLVHRADFYSGGSKQIVVENPWFLKDVKALDSWQIVK